MGCHNGLHLLDLLVRNAALYSLHLQQPPFSVHSAVCRKPISLLFIASQKPQTYGIDKADHHSFSYACKYADG